LLYCRRNRAQRPGQRTGAVSGGPETGGPIHGPSAPCHLEAGAAIAGAFI
jgi:hypothetical protein